MKDNYLEFLKRKIAIAKDLGFEIEDNMLPDVALPHQRDIIKWAIKGGRRGIFVNFGMGKTLIQLSIADIITRKKGGKSLIICPLGIKQEFFNDAENLLNFEIEYVKTNEECINSENKILITNYERVRDGDIDVKQFIHVTLDEASVLRSFGSKTYQTFLQKFKGIPYKHVCTATPSPNKYKELIHYAGYLDVMDTGQALTRFFKRDSQKANNLTLYPHKEQEFWYWLSSWGVFAQRPSDMGYKDDGFDLPPLDVHYHKLNVDHSTAGVDEDGQVRMLRSSAIGMGQAAREKRESIDVRVDKMKEIIDNDPESNYIIWHDLETERKAIKKELPEVTEVYGNLSMEEKEKKILDFSYGRTKYLATKPILNGSGCNFQRYCHKAIFLGINYKFNDLIQAIHRIYRYLQTEQVEIHFIYMESEDEIMKTLLEKWRNHNHMVEKMVNIIKENGINSKMTTQKLLRTMGIERKTIKTQNSEIINNDAVLETMEMKDNSIDMILTSIPFSNHYEYTPSYNDFGHTKSNNHFWEQMDYLTKELYRVIKPGRVTAIHVKDRILFSSMTDFSFPTISPFHAECIFHFMKHQFGYMGCITIETDVVRENNQTYRLGWTEQCKDGSKMGVGSPEYLLLFRKQPTNHERGYADMPVEKDKSLYTRGMWQIDARAKWNSSGNRFLRPKEIKQLNLDKIETIFRNYFESNVYDYQKHKNAADLLDKYGRLPATFEMLKIKSRNWYLWDDINRMGTLNTSQSRKNKNMHICPLQFDIVDRVINRFTNEGETIFDPFAGLMTVPYRAVMKKRKAIGTELNKEYWRDGCSYVRASEYEVNMPTLFDTIEV